MFGMEEGRKGDWSSVPGRGDSSPERAQSVSCGHVCFRGRMTAPGWLHVRSEGEAGIKGNSRIWALWLSG